MAASAVAEVVVAAAVLMGVHWHYSAMMRIRSGYPSEDVYENGNEHENDCECH